MRRVFAPIVVVCLLVAAPLAVAQDSGLPDKDMLAKVLDAWSTLSTDNVVRFYDATSPFPFYDVAPLKFDSFPAYMTGFKEMAATLTSLTFTLNPDLRHAPRGTGLGGEHRHPEDEDGAQTGWRGDYGRPLDDSLAEARRGLGDRARPLLRAIPDGVRAVLPT